MAGISSEALNNLPENKYKYNGIEKEDAFEIGIYDAQLRELDGQTGRWWQIDPKTENMEMWSPYASNYDNPITYMDFLGDEPESADGCCGALLNLVEDVLISASGVLNGAVNTLSFGLISSDPFGMRDKLGGDKLDLYNNSVTVGKVGPLFTLGGARAKSPPMELIPVVGKGSTPVSVKTQPVSPPVVPFAQQNSSGKGGGKNAQHANQKAREAAQKKYEAAKENYNTLKSKANKTKEDKTAEAKAKTEMIHQKKKMDETGENHSQKAKGSN